MIFEFQMLTFCIFLFLEDNKETKPRSSSNARSKDRKSPNTVQADVVPNDSDEDKKEPKVPPLKIVLSNSSEVDTSIRYDKFHGHCLYSFITNIS